MIAGILFDKDGTLFDFAQSWGDWAAEFLHALARHDPVHAQTLGSRIGFDVVTRRFDHDSPAIAGTNADIARLLKPSLPEMTEGALVARIHASVAGARMVPAVPLVPLLAELRARGLRLGVATNDAETPARAHLAAAGVLDAFDFVAGYDSGYGAKPGPGMCTAFAEAFALDTTSVVMVGDSLHDLIAGNAAGMRSVAVLTGIAQSAELAPHAQAVLPDIGHLPAWLDEVFEPNTPAGGRNTTRSVAI